jgi:ankyrin repeat protein
MRARFLIGLACTVTSFAATNGSPSVAEAAKNQQKTALQALLKQKAAVNAPDVEGMTALMWAAHWNDLEMTQMLLKAGADPKLKSTFDDNALYEACLNGNAAIVEALLKAGADPNMTRGEGETALMTASRSGNLDTVKALLAHSANVNAKEPWREETALMWASAENHPDVVKALIAAGADVNAKSILWKWPEARKLRGGDLPVVLPDGGFTPLMFAAREGSLEPARLLLEAGADLNYKEPQGYDPLLIAIYNGHYELATLMIEKGAKVDNGALWMAIETRNMDKSDKHPAPTDYGKVKSMDMIKMLLAKGAPVDGGLKSRLPQRAIMEGGGPAVGSPLYRATKSTDVAAMRLLLENGADPKYKLARDSSTLIMAAAGQGFNKESGVGGEQKDAIEAIKMLMEKGVDVNAANDQGQTALHFAALTGREKVIEFLYENGAKLDVKDKRGRTPYDVATGVGNGGNAEAVPEPEALEMIQKLLAKSKTTAKAD